MNSIKISQNQSQEIIKAIPVLHSQPESEPAVDSFGRTRSYLDFLHLLFISDVHLLQGVLQLLVPLQQSLPQLCRQVEV